MTSFKTLLDQLMLGDETSQQEAMAGIEEFGDFIRAQAEIRVFIDKTKNFGHQATTIHLLKRTIDRFGYDRRVRIVWEPAATSRGGINDTARKLGLLLTGLDPRNIADATITYGSCTDIRFIDLNNPLGQLNDRSAFGFTGGADDLDVNYAERLNVDAFLRLQPFVWRLPNNSFVPNQIEFNPASHRQTIILGQRSPTLDLLPYKFIADAVRTVPPGVWQWYGETQTYDDTLKLSTNLASALWTGAGQRQAKIWPTYGLHQFDKSEMPLNVAIVAGWYQSRIEFSGPPVVVCLFNKPDELDFSYTDYYKNQDIKGFKTKISADYGMSKANESNFQAFFTTIEDFMEINEPKDHLRILSGVLTPTQVSEAIAQSNNGDVLMVCVGNVPRDIFNLIFVSSMAPLFEGQGTSSLMIALGWPYLQMPKQGLKGNNYPGIPPVALPEDFDTEYCNETAESIRRGYNSYLTSKPPASYENMVIDVTIFIESSATPDHFIAQYFASLGVFYSQELHDKLSLGWVAYNAARHGTLQAASLRLTRAEPVRTGATAVALTTPATLDEIYDNLIAAWSDGGVDLLAALPGTRFADYWQAVVGAAFPVTVAHDDITATRAPDGTATLVTVAQATTAVFPIPFDLTLTFSADNDGPIQSLLHCRGSQVWDIDGAPWLQFSKPGFDMQVVEAAAPVQGRMVGTITSAADLTVGIRYPVEEDRWVITGTFAAPLPSIGSFFQMAGGINLVQTLPSPLNALAGFGLQETQIIYDQAATSIVYSQFVFSTASPWVLLKDPSITLTPTVSYAITNPGDLARRTWQITATGTFTIGAGTVTITTEYPDFSVSGALTEGVIMISDLVALFKAHLDTEAAITNFTFFVKPATGYFTVAADAVLDAPITIGAVTLFKLNTLNLATSGGDGHYTVTLAGTTTILPDSPQLTFALSLSATYDTLLGWSFQGRQIGGAIALGALLAEYLGWHTGDDYGIADLSLTFDTGTGSWAFGGATAEPWHVPFLPEIQVAARFQAGSNATSQHGTADTTGEVVAGPFGRVDLDWTWQNIDLTVWFDYQPEVTEFGITWGLLQGTVSGPAEKTGDYTATLRFTETVTVGSLVETMVSWLTGSRFGLEAPWSVLDNIPLSGVALVYLFNPKDSKRNKVMLDVSIGPIDLGFARIDSLALGYQSTGPDRGVMVTLQGSFPWNVGGDAVGDTGALGPWDASQPGKAPAPPGNGNKYLDLRLLALGQRVTYPGLTSVTSVQQAIALMADLPEPTPGQLPPVRFDPDSNWLIGTDFGVLKLGEGEDGDTGSGYFLTLQIVFNDPSLYALRIALDGSMAKVFKGLDFQILYRQISDTVGVYSAEITLPTIMRRIDVGAYTITLPVFSISIYTNGDFQTDIGFPWNTDFSRSFTIEAIIPPGIPMLGSGGFYFGKLSSATSTQVPAVTNGTFNPVLVFGFGMQVGFGKSVEYGILSAGFSLTMVGILEGVLATWNPYHDSGTTLPASQIQGNYYFKVIGTVGILGKLYGAVDFGIIKANVDVEISLMIQIAYECYVSLTLTVIASVSVTASIRINLGLFKITMHFSFSLRIKESFTVPNSGQAPWLIASSSSVTAASLLSRPASARTSALRRGLRSTTALSVSGPSAPSWSNLLPAGAKLPLTGYAAMGLTGARGEWPDHSGAGPCWVTMLFIDSVPPAGSDDGLSQGADTPFETLAKMVARWTVAAIQAGPLSAAQVDALVVSEDDLDLLLEVVLASSDDNLTPIPIAAIDPFFDGQFVMSVRLPPDEDTTVNAAYFPVPGALSVSVPAYGNDYPALSYQFGAYNSIDSAGLRSLRAYFDALAIQVQEEQGNSALKARATADDGTAMAEWIRSDYLLLIARQMIQAFRDGLRDFKLPLTAGAQPQAMVDQVNATGQLSGDAQVTVSDLFSANASHPLSAGKTVRIDAGTLVPVDAPSFNNLALDYASDGLNGQSLATANATANTILAPGQSITYPGKTPQSHQIVAGDTLFSVAAAFGAVLADLLSDTTVLDQPGLLVPGAALALPLITTSALAGDSFTAIAGRATFAGALTPTALALANAGRPVLRNGAKVTYPDRGETTVQPRDVLGDLALRLGVSLSDLLAHGSPLTQTDLLADVALLALPGFELVTVADDTLTAVAARFGTTPARLGEVAANQTAAGLFALAAPDGSDAGTLDLPHLPQYQVGALIEEAQRALALQNLSGMASRYYLHGLRLPTDGITPKARGMWVRDQGGTLVLPPLAGLFALTGQQLPVPTSFTSTPFTVTLDRTAGPSWLRFLDAARTPVDTLTVSVVAGSDDANRITSIAACIATRLEIPLLALGAGPMAQRDWSSYPLSSVTSWLSAEPVAMPNGAAASGDQTLRLWTLPDSLTCLPDPATRRVNPRFAISLSRYDEASGSTVSQSVGAYGWASVISFTVRRVPEVPDSPASRTTYEVVGADDDSIVILERLLDTLDNQAGAIASLRVGFCQDSGSGVQTDATVTLGLSQANLSTETRPPQATLARMALATAVAPMGLLNPSTLDFLRLLWEASITRAGGFYLYYYDGAAARGLPERVFNDKGEAVLTAIVLYANPTAAADQNRLTNFMNAVVTADGFDTNHTSVIARADPPRDPWPSVVATASDTLASLAYREFGTLSELAAANATVPFVAGRPLVVAQGLYQPPPGPGMALAEVAARFGITVAALQAANGGTLPEPLVFPRVAELPLLTLTTGTSAHSTHLQDVASWYGLDLTALAADNALVPGLYLGRTVALPGGPRTQSGTVAVGTAAVQALRPVPPDVPDRPLSATDSAWAWAYLQHDVSLLSYQVAETADFTASTLSLPAGPTTPEDSGDSSQPNDKVRRPKVTSPGDPDWQFRQDLPYYRYARSGDGTSPYDGVGGVLQVDFQWQDLYGNQMATTLSVPQAGDSGPFNQPPIRVGYTDALIGLGQWPSVGSSWQVTTAEAGGAQIVLALSFDQSSYDGLIEATAPSATGVLARFTQALDQASAGRPANYSLSEDSGADAPTVTTAALQADGRSVLLTLSSALADDSVLTLTVSNLATTEGQAVSGQARCAYPDLESTRSSTVRSNAAQAMRTCTTLRDQLNDPNGISLTVSTTVMVDDHGKTRITPLSTEQVAALKAWLFDGTSSSSSILGFVSDRADGRTTVAPPPADSHVVLPVAAASVNPAQIFSLSLSVSLTRTGGSVYGPLATASGIRSTSFTVPPFMSGADGTLALTSFAQKFESALSQAGAFRLRVATGVDRFAAIGSANSPLWVVRVGATSTNAIAYTITTPSGDPAIFAPQPISNRLESRSGVPIRTYATGKGLSAQSQPTDFANVDLDIWGRQLFSAVDGVLTPKYLPPTQILDVLDGNAGRLQALLDAKEDLARITCRLMVPLYADQAGADAAFAQEAFRQELLAALSNAYTVRAALGFDASVTASVDQSEPPRLYGAATINPQVTAVVADPEAATAVLVVFNTVMAAEPAKSAGNYTVSGEISVSEALLSADGHSVTLRLTRPVTPGQTTVTVSDALTDLDGWPLQPPLTRTVTTEAAPSLASTINLSSPKLTLQSGTDQPLTILVAAPEVVRDSHNSVVSSLDLTLRYTGSAIEHQIGHLTGIEDYPVSSWLSFVLSEPVGPLTADLGTFPVPLVLRGFPTTPDLPAQSGTGTAQAGTSELAQILMWELGLTYALPFHYPQDRVYVTVTFNAAVGLRLMASLRDAFPALAQFVTAYPAVQSDLDAWLAGIDATIDATDPAGQERITNATVALSTLLEMVSDIVAAAGGGDSGSLALRQAAEPGLGSLDYGFYVTETATDWQGTAGALVVSVVGAPPAGIGVPAVLVDPDHYDAVLISDPAGDTFSYVYQEKGGTTFLTAETGQALTNRSVVLPALNILQRQDARISVYLTRNQELVPRRPSAPEFVYTTPKVSFANPVFPSITWDEPIDLARIGNGPGPFFRSLRQHLTALFAALLANDTQPTLSIQVQVSYRYTLTPFSTISLPVLMQAPLSVATSGTGAGTLEQMIATWSDAIEIWYASQGPSANQGTLGFDLLLLSDLTEEPLPLVQLSALSLALMYLQPPLAAG